MGLDQWIFKKPYINEKGELIEEEKVIYWRKCNQIQGWFDRLVGGVGVENCKNYDITLEDIKNLNETCKKVLSDHSLASELLPVTAGFFYGSYEYDQFYFMDLEFTVKELSKFLSDDHTDEEYYYHSWW